MEIIEHQFSFISHCLVNIKNPSSYYRVTNKSYEIAGHRKKDCFRTLFMNFLDELTRT